MVKILNRSQMTVNVANAMVISGSYKGLLMCELNKKANDVVAIVVDFLESDDADDMRADGMFYHAIHWFHTNHPEGDTEIFIHALVESKSEH